MGMAGIGKYDLAETQWITVAIVVWLADDADQLVPDPPVDRRHERVGTQEDVGRYRLDARAADHRPLADGLPARRLDVQVGST